MSPITSLEYVFVLLVLLIVVGIDSQIRFPTTKSPSPDCNCIEIRRCPPLINRRDWKTAGETCEYGNGRYRKVCCPDSWWAPERSTTTAPPPLRPRPRPRPPSRTTTTQRLPIITTSSTTEYYPEVVTFRPVGGGPVDRAPSPIQDCGRVMSGLKPLIMGGQNATEGMWPWMAAIRIRERTGIYTPWCTGFLIDSWHVMSAAHCFETTDNDQYRARIGSVNQDIADEYRFTRIAIHEGYRPGQFYNDIAILTLDREVNFPDFNPICLPDDQVSKMKLTRTGTTVAGWGADRHGGRLKIHLQYLTRLPVITNQECTRRLRTILRDSFRRQFPNGVSKDLICAGFDEGGKDACGGDSGGPLMILKGNRWYAIGIVSFGVKCGMPMQPGGYTKIASHLDWIAKNTQ